MELQAFPSISQSKTRESSILIHNCLLLTLRALVGEVTPQLRAVITDIIEDKTLFIRFYFDGLVADEVLYSCEVAITQAFADFGPEYTLDAKIEQIDYPQKLPLKPRSVYRRFETQYLV